MMRVWSILAALAIVLSAGSSAYGFCYEPSAPYCAGQYGAFSDQWDFDNCKRSMESYASEVEAFMICRSEEADGIAEDAYEDADRDKTNALDAYNSAVDDFNDRADG